MKAAIVTCSRGATLPYGGRLHISDVLRELSVPALEAFVEALRKSKDVQNARLACRELRDVIDQNMREVKLNVRHQDQKTWEPSVVPSMSRWHLCSSVTLNITGAEAFDQAQVAHIISTCFQCLKRAPRQTRRRIKRLTLQLEPRLRDTDDEHMETVLSALLLRLPALEELELHGLGGMMYNPMAQRSIFDSLASLRHLQRLTLPGDVLEYLDVLAGSNSSLRCLHVDGGAGATEDVQLDPATFDSISQLSSLQELRLERFIIADEFEESFYTPKGHSSLRLLLRSLPPSLQLLQLHYCDCLAARGVSLDLRLDAGRVREAELPMQDTDLDFLATILGPGGLMPLLLGEGTQGTQQRPPQPQQQRRRLERFRINTLVEVEDKDPLPEDKVDSLKALGRSVLKLEIGRVSTNVYVMSNRLQQILELQPAPQRFELEIPMYGENKDLPDDDPDTFPIMIRNVRQATSSIMQQPVAEASGAVGGQSAPPSLPAPPQPASPPPPLPSTRELIQRMVPHMMTGPAAVAGPAAEGTQHSSLAMATGAGAAAPTTSALPDWMATSPQVLLMKGPFMALLAQDEGLLEQWLKTLEKRAAALTACGGVGGGRRCIVRYLVLPSTDAVLVGCNPGTAATVLQAATAIMQAAQGVAASTAATAAAADASLQVLPVALREAPSRFLEGFLAHFFLTVFEQVVQEAWDAATEAGGPDVLRRQLEWLLGLMHDVWDLMPLSRPLD
ncbi:hypothetical protein Agub_g10876 [Astrephomene gubernaculifera]|uniref:Uncharacterized protein n=1 Tax=Astrephomene gubernaculifera TaxID=47775 RepID=A0AAD3HQD9_9CHLO|nr:hypothetical protein Agub_g10876 [Astrephomene gubernaculifera]